jgi:hypothetical protein
VTALFSATASSDIYRAIRQRAREIAGTLPPPDFYQTHAEALGRSAAVFDSNPLVRRLYAFASENIEDDFGHGLQHSARVAIEAGALVIVEMQGLCQPEHLIVRRTIVAHCAGLLHDIKRKQHRHAVAGADFARRLLQHYPLTPAEIEDITAAIRNHEAFQKTVAIDTVDGLLLAGCLYDADKFRWGPDNFTDTIWDMVIHARIPLADFVGRYSQGMDTLVRIRSTFRTATGKRCGPQFIDMGIAIGQRLIEVIHGEFSRYLKTRPTEP